jgi:cysteine synthase B
MTLQYQTIADCVGNTPLVRLQRMAGNTSNTLLLKLEGNNPAGSVKDRPALSMITRAEARGQIHPGDTLIEATSGNTGIALAMAAAIKGYRMILIMPDNSSAERKAAMTAYGAELILVSKEEGMEGARDLAERMQAEGHGKVLDQFANGDNPQAHYVGTGPEIWRQTGGTITHFVSSMGTTGTIMGTSRFLKEQNPNSDRRPPAYGWRVDSRYPPLADRVPAEHLPSRPRRSDHGHGPGRSRGRHASSGAGRRHFLWRVVGRFGCRHAAVVPGSRKRGDGRDHL